MALEPGDSHLMEGSPNLPGSSQGRVATRPRLLFGARFFRRREPPLVGEAEVGLAVGTTVGTDGPRGKGQRDLEEADTAAVVEQDETARTPDTDDTAVAIETARTITSIDEADDTGAAQGEPTARPTDAAATRAGGDVGTNSESGPTAFAEGSKIGRFIVLRKLGEGGMGVVLAAHDPMLDRKVALKLLRPRSSGKQVAQSARQRLIREAQAMAKLAHPNVIPVFDAGEIGDQVFIAMLFVDGETIGQWAKREKRSWREVLDVYIEAGRGLAAAHEAGLVHRDFKPDNVLVSKDGRVRVTDFGLVSTSETPSAKAVVTGRDADPLTTATPFGTSLTRTGSLLGTPIYMAPEQHERKKADARTDQFSFCVALHEALYGQRPFEGDAYWQLVANVVGGKIAEPPKDSDVPGWIRQILLRGLSSNKQGRYPSMESLIAALEHDPAAARRRRLTAAAIAAVILVLGGLATFGLVRGGEAARQLCKGARQKLVGVWDEDKKAAVEQAFVDTGRPYAGDVYVRVEKHLDDYANAWVAARTEACEATHFHGEQSEEALDLRIACLDHRLRKTRALMDLFAERPDTGVLDKAIQAAHELPSLAECADVEALRAPYSAPKDPDTRAEVELLREQLARADALLRAGKYGEARSTAAQAAERAVALGYRPVDAEAQLLLGIAQEREGSFDEARASLTQAFTAGLASNHKVVMADAAIHLVSVVGDRLEEHERGLQWAGIARAALEQGGAGGELAEAMLLHNLGALRMRKGEYREALAHNQDALRMRRQVLGDEHPLVAISEHGLGLIHEQLARYDEALAHYQHASAVFEKTLGSEHPITSAVLNSVGNVQSIRGDHAAAIATYRRVAELMEKSLGPEHPSLGVVYNNIGIELKEIGKLDEAIATHRLGLAIREKTLGPEHPDVAASLTNLAEVYREKGELDEALTHNRRALLILEAALGPDHPIAARVRGNLAATLGELGSYDEAEELLQRSLVDMEKALGPDHDRVALVLSHLATIARERGRLRKALALQQRALAIHEKALGPDNPSLAQPLTDLGNLYRQLGRTADAVAAAERAVRILETKPERTALLAESRFALARALTAARGDRRRAIELAEQARNVFAEAGDAMQKELAEVDAWLKDQGPN